MTNCCEKCQIHPGGSGGGLPADMCWSNTCPCHTQQKEVELKNAGAPTHKELTEAVPQAVDDVLARFDKWFENERERLLPFFRQELLALAEEAQRYHPSHMGPGGGRCEGCAVVDLIRSKADELV